MIKGVFLIVGILIFVSCSNTDNEELIGTSDDTIKLSTKSVDLTAKADSVVITTEGDFWWIEGISFKDSLYSYDNREDIDLESEAYLIKEDDFVVERRDKNTFFVKINKNNTGVERKMNVYLEAGNYFDNVSIVQSAD